MDLLVEYRLLEDEENVLRSILALPFSVKKQLFPKDGLYIMRKLKPLVRDVQMEMQSLVTGERLCMDGYGTLRNRGPVEHGPHPFHDERPSHSCKKESDGRCKASTQNKHLVVVIMENMVCANA